MNAPIIIYTNSTIRCPYCIRAKAALTKHGFEFDERDVADPVIRDELRAKRPSARTVPQIFLTGNDYYIGGCDDLLPIIDRLDVMIEINS